MPLFLKMRQMAATTTLLPTSEPVPNRQSAFDRHICEIPNTMCNNVNKVCKALENELYHNTYIWSIFDIRDKQRIKKYISYG